MSHVTLKSGYTDLVDRLNRFPQGAPPSESLYKILAMLFSEREAAIVSQLPIKPFTAPQAARILKMPLAETRGVLDELAGRAILVDTEHDGETTYILPPPMAGFFEFSMMRMRGDVDQKVLGELFYQYLNVEEDFIRNLFVSGETQLGRVFVHEPVLTNDNALHVLDYERASEVIQTATHRGIGVCYCRHKMMHVERNCDAPMEICMTFNGSADSLIRHGYARSVDVSEGLDLLQQAYESNLVQFGENVRERVNFICNCCGCCCEAMIAARKFGMLNPVHTSNFLPVVDEAQCNGCGKCVDRLPGRGDDARLGERGARPEGAQGQARRGHLPGLRRVRADLPAQSPEPALAARAGDHAAQLAAPRGRDGDRARRPAGPDLRQPRAVEPPRPGRRLRRRPEACRRSSRPWRAGR